MSTDRSESEQEEGSSVETQLAALPIGAIDVEEGGVPHVWESISIDVNAIPHHLPADSTSAVLRTMDAGGSNLVCVLKSYERFNSHLTVS
ncbi:hypothetical protein FA15DRAFT_296192 [Coprinopsis marcescibilis]|uniref:Uncharacterized protein n=1 Tax=Coprinopsis marcescibilis TaxID=230819 RepID=A0A5C3KDW5_COPMA|nr:hypothetical protein FA15DRAFT_296192 [Coprinopsis marcescibilis]